MSVTFVGRVLNVKAKPSVLLKEKATQCRHEWKTVIAVSKC